LQVKFPREKFTVSVVDMTESPPHPFVGAEQLSRVQIDLHTGAEPKVEGYGKPFANPGHPSHAWINGGAPIIGDLSLLDMLQQRSFVFFVNDVGKYMTPKFATMPPPFSYPYSTEGYGWDMARYQEDIPKNKVSPFQPASLGFSRWPLVKSVLFYDFPWTIPPHFLFT
jgi:hypothetical protein